MIIRPANKFDLPYFIDLIHRINNNDELGDIVCAELDDKHLNSIFATVLAGAGLCFIAESDTKVGMILGVISPNMWQPSYLFIHQVLYYVEDDYRGTKAGYMLFKEYDKACQKLVDEKRIHHITLTAPRTFIDMNFERFDYELSEKTWIKKGMRHE